MCYWETKKGGAEHSMSKAEGFFVWEECDGNTIETKDHPCSSGRSHAWRRTVLGDYAGLFRERGCVAEAPPRRGGCSSGYKPQILELIIIWVDSIA